MKTFRDVFLYWVFISTFLLCICSNYFTIYAEYHSDIQFSRLSFPQYFINMAKIITPSLNFFAAIIGLLVTLISIAIPLTINKVSDCLQPYNDEEIQRMFHKEKVFKQMIFIMVLLAIALCFWFFMRDSFLIGFVLLSFALLALFFFYVFILRVIDYITATDDVVTEYLLQRIHDILNGVFNE
jgi:hypothetical protein